jgi:O-antigen/teichoic acid export membrane protein
MAPTRGLVNTLFRNLAGLSEERRPVLIRTAFLLAVFVLGGVAALGFLACLIAWFCGAAEPEVALWIAILILAIAAQNLVLVTTADLAVKRDFAQSTLWRSIGSLLSFMALAGFVLIGHLGMPTGYTLGYLTGLGALLIFRRNTLLGKPQLDKGMAKKIATTWIVLSISALFFGSGRYIHRTILGSFGSYEMVSVFFASAAAVQLFAVPVSALGGFGLQLVSAHPSIRSLSPRLLRWYPVAAVIGAVGFYGLVHWMAPWIVHLLYPTVGDSALVPISIMAPGFAISVLHFAARPLVIKFSPRRAVMTISIATVGAHLISALLLIPAWGIVGAAWAYCIGASVSGLTWFGFLLAIIFRPGRDADRAVSVDHLDLD